jgi:hypothetical protein
MPSTVRAQQNPPEKNLFDANKKITKTMLEKSAINCLLSWFSFSANILHPFIWEEDDDYYVVVVAAADDADGTTDDEVVSSTNKSIELHIHMVDQSELKIRSEKWNEHRAVVVTTTDRPSIGKWKWLLSLSL